MFVHSDGSQLRKITEIVEKNKIVPDIDSRIFSLSQVNEALALVTKGGVNGKIIIQL